jgi:hypothetical protein
MLLLEKPDLALQKPTGENEHRIVRSRQRENRSPESLGSASAASAPRPASGAARNCRRRRRTCLQSSPCWLQIPPWLCFDYVSHCPRVFIISPVIWIAINSRDPIICILTQLFTNSSLIRRAINNCDPTIYKLPPVLVYPPPGRPLPPCSRPESGSSFTTLSNPSTSAPLRSSVYPSAKRQEALASFAAEAETSEQPQLELARWPGMSTGHRAVAARRCSLHLILRSSC